MKNVFAVALGILTAILLASGAEVTTVKQVQRQGKNPVALQPGRFQVVGDMRAPRRQLLRQLQHPVELLLGALFLPLLVVKVLTASGDSVQRPEYDRCDED